VTPVEYDPSEESTCTTCDYSEDFSNYWTANLYFKARNGTYKRVKQMVNLVSALSPSGISKAHHLFRGYKELKA